MATTFSESCVRFSLEDARAACHEWRFNCGPGALCAILDMTPDEIRPHLLDFERKGYTNPSLMANILRRLKVPFVRVFEQLGQCHWDALQTPRYPGSGLFRVQWDGPWCDPGRPAVARYRHTHWVGVRQAQPPAQPLQYPKSGYPGREVFDVNAMCTGGWLSWDEWVDDLTPWLIQQCEPKASGRWWPTHCWEIEPLMGTMIDVCCKFCDGKGAVPRDQSQAERWAEIAAAKAAESP